MWVAFANAKATHIFFCKNISVYAILNDQSFNDTLTNDIVSFEQMGPVYCKTWQFNTNGAKRLVWSTFHQLTQTIGL